MVSGASKRGLVGKAVPGPGAIFHPSSFLILASAMTTLSIAELLCKENVPDSPLSHSSILSNIRKTLQFGSPTAESPTTSSAPADVGDLTLNVSPSSTRTSSRKKLPLIQTTLCFKDCTIKLSERVSENTTKQKRHKRRRPPYQLELSARSLELNLNGDYVGITHCSAPLDPIQTLTEAIQRSLGHGSTIPPTSPIQKKKKTVAPPSS
nr:VP3 [Yellow-eyed penguin gyrovirus]WBV79709.1 VP3 [Yellow-eyed penguin gyrovirus]WBV79718.1 VP3 [Yellow-eyed penguin gyrovirus]WBV79727.1 VP3 [Yellow-eyed penguin gyrovirus]WBV79730.1 VP3 [Yellow-eyed penguin gyrovirus]